MSGPDKKRAKVVCVTGATGNTGSAAIRALAAQKRELSIIGVVRNENKAGHLASLGVTVAKADAEDVAALARAFRKASAVYVCPPPTEDCEELCINYIQAARAAKAKKIVLLSVAPGEGFLARKMAGVEAALRESGMRFTILRATFFQENLLAMADTIRQGQLFLPLGDTRTSPISVADIGECIAGAMLSKRHDSMTYLLTGGDAVSGQEMAASFSRCLGRTVAYTAVPREAARTEMLAQGYPTYQIDSILDMYKDCSDGRASVPTDDVQQITGHRARTFAEFVSEYTEHFVGGASSSQPVYTSHVSAAHYVLRSPGTTLTSSMTPSVPSTTTTTYVQSAQTVPRPQSPQRTGSPPRAQSPTSVTTVTRAAPAPTVLTTTSAPTVSSLDTETVVVYDAPIPDPSYQSSTYGSVSRSSTYGYDPYSSSGGYVASAYPQYSYGSVRYGSSTPSAYAAARTTSFRARPYTTESSARYLASSSVSSRPGYGTAGGSYGQGAMGYAQGYPSESYASSYPVEKYDSTYDTVGYPSGSYSYANSSRGVWPSSRTNGATSSGQYTARGGYTSRAYV